MKLKHLIAAVILSVGFSGASADSTTAAKPAQIIDTNTVNLSRHAQKSRQATVRVVSAYGHGSGTYVKVGKHYGIMTAAHVIEGSQMLLVDSENGQTVGFPLWFDAENDLAFLYLPGPLQGKSPLKLAHDEKIKAGADVVYSGFPSTHEMLTFKCSIANADSETSITVQGYAWFGASGSGFINERGHVFAILSAVPVENFYGHPQVTTALVFANRITESHIKKIKAALTVLEANVD